MGGKALLLLISRNAELGLIFGGQTPSSAHRGARLFFSAGAVSLKWLRFHRARLAV